MQEDEAERGGEFQRERVLAVRSERIEGSQPPGNREIDAMMTIGTTVKAAASGTLPAVPCWA